MLLALRFVGDTAFPLFIFFISFSFSFDPHLPFSGDAPARNCFVVGYTYAHRIGFTARDSAVCAHGENDGDKLKLHKCLFLGPEFRSAWTQFSLSPHSYPRFAFPALCVWYITASLA